MEKNLPELGIELWNDHITTRKGAKWDADGEARICSVLVHSSLKLPYDGTAQEWPRIFIRKPNTCFKGLLVLPVLLRKKRLENEAEQSCNLRSGLVICSGGSDT